MPDAGNFPYLVFDAKTQVPINVAKHKTAHVSVVATGKDKARWVRTTSLVNNVRLEALCDPQHGELLAILIVSKVFKLPAQIIFDFLPTRNRSLELASYEPTGARFCWTERAQ